MFKKFPKTRSKLPLAYQKIYHEHYLNNREGNGKTTSISRKMEQWMHIKVASDVKENRLKNNCITLEIGAGNLNHLAYEPNVSSYDVIEPYKELYDTSKVKTRIGTIYNDISDIEINKSYDRITSIACFEHVLDLPLLVAQTCNHLNKKGQLRVAIPNEGTFLWRLGTMVTGFEFKKNYGLNYDVLMKHEHVNTAEEIEEILKFFFNNVKRNFFGMNKKLAFYCFYICEDPNNENVERYFSEIIDN